jgi:hypothetical protein
MCRVLCEVVFISTGTVEGSDECCESALLRFFLCRDSNMVSLEYEAAVNFSKTHFNIILHLYPDLRIIFFQ